MTTLAAIFLKVYEYDYRVASLLPCVYTAICIVVGVPSNTTWPKENSIGDGFPDRHMSRRNAQAVLVRSCKPPSTVAHPGAAMKDIPGQFG